MAESDVVRLIIVARLREWLEISDNEAFASNYWRRVDYRRLGYKMLRELKSNRTTISAWALVSFEAVPPSQAYPLYYFLDDKSTMEFVELHSEIHPGRLMSLASPQNYLAHVATVNAKLTELRRRLDQERLNQWEQQELVISTIEAILKSDEIRWLLQNSYGIERDVFRSLGTSLH